MRWSSSPSAPAGALTARSAWSIVTTPNAGSVANQLNAVSCVSTSDCWAVGYSKGTGPLARNLAEHWNGRAWTIVPVPVTGPDAYDALQSVACVSDDDCWAVGFTANPGSRTRAVHWNGRAWMIVTTVDPSDFQGLSSVTCTAANNCWAVGGASRLVSDFNRMEFTVAEHWDGHTWSIVATPNPLDNSAFIGVTCAGATSCWAVGQSLPQGKTVAEHWDGHAWSVVATPNASPASNDLVGVSCSSPHDCWAVGEANVGFSSQDRTLAEHWNGRSWSIVPTPNLDPDNDNTLWSVTCPRSRLCWAVGWSNGKTLEIPGHTEIMRWTGRAWSLVTSPDPSATENSELRGVACGGRGSHGRATTDCWTVGAALAAAPSETPSQTLAERGPTRRAAHRTR